MSSRKKRKKEKEKNIRNSASKKERKKERKKNCRGIAWAVEFSKGSIDDDVDGSRNGTGCEDTRRRCVSALRKYGEGPIRSGEEEEGREEEREERGRRSLWDRKFIGTRWLAPMNSRDYRGPIEIFWW